MNPIRAPLLFAACLLLAASFDLGAATPAGEGGRWSLGAVVDVRAADARGAQVLAVTPGGAAERLGVQPGDRLLAVNGRALDAGAADALAEAVQAGNGKLRLELARDGRRLALSGQADRDPLASAADACGRVTTSGSPPRMSENVYPVRIYDIDGTGTPLGAWHELQAGTHVLLVEEAIDRHRFDAMQLERRDRMRARLGPRAAKALLVEVAADTRYRVGARLFPERIDTAAGINDNGYWEPVVWATEPAPCRR